MNRYILLFILTYFKLTPASAHVRWFVQDTGRRASFPLDGLANVIVLGAVLFCIACYLYHKKVTSRPPYWLTLPWTHSVKWWLLSASFAFMLLFCLTHGQFMAPNLPTDILDDPAILVYLQGITVFFCLNLISLQLAGLGLLALTFFALAVYPLPVMIDYVFEFSGASLALILTGLQSDKFSLRIISMPRHNLEQWAVFALRTGIGLQLMELSIHNKLLNPALGLAFLQEYHFNFMHAAGLQNFTDIYFVLMAGVAEFSFGLLIFFGIAVRLVTLITSLFFVTTMFVIGFHELAGHLPIFVFVLILLTKEHQISTQKTSCFFPHEKKLLPPDQGRSAKTGAGPDSMSA